MSTSNNNLKLDLAKAEDANPWQFASADRWLEGAQYGFNCGLEASQARIAELTAQLEFVNREHPMASTNVVLCGNKHG